MSEHPVPGAEAQLAAQVASAHYLDGLNKVEIAERLGMSRFRVARLLETARDAGIVTFVIRPNPRPEDALAARLRASFKLRECIVTRTDPERPRSVVATAAAGYLSSHLSEDDVLGLSWGRTLAAMTGYLGELPPAKIVQLTGSVGNDLAISPLEVLRQATARSGGEAFPIVAPLLADSPESAQTIRRQPDISRALNAYPDLTVAAVSVGSWSPTTSQLRSSLTDVEQEALEAMGVEGEVSGIFLSADGTVLDLLCARMIGITADELRPVPQKVVVAEGAPKAAIVKAAILAGLANALIIDRSLAEELLRGDR